MVIMKPAATEEQIQAVIAAIRAVGMETHLSRGAERTLIGIIGDEREVDFAALEALPGVERAMRILKPYKYVSRSAAPEGKTFRVGDVTIGRDLVFMAGPCSVEEEDVTLRIAVACREAGIQIFRGGAYKPRTSAWAFQGLREKGLEILSRVKRETGMPIITEIIDAGDLQTVAAHTDIFQVGMRNMRNYSLLTSLGQAGKPVLLKRGDSSTLEEWLAAAEYIVRNGNDQVILCERGIRTFETYTRNTLDLNAVAGAKLESCLPVFADPSHGTGRREMVPTMALASVAAGADGLMIECHFDPDHAWSDGKQTVGVQDLGRMVDACRRVHQLTRSLP